jgi:GGDEF domain-containing protein
MRQEPAKFDAFGPALAEALRVMKKEAGRDIAARVVSRVRERLAAEGEAPALSVSAGVAAFPEDGETPEKLLGAADRALYRMKHHRASSSIQNLSRIAACL